MPRYLSRDYFFLSLINVLFICTNDSSFLQKEKRKGKEETKHGKLCSLDNDLNDKIRDLSRAERRSQITSTPERVTGKSELEVKAEGNLLRWQGI